MDFQLSVDYWETEAVRAMSLFFPCEKLFLCTSRKHSQRGKDQRTESSHMTLYIESSCQPYFGHVLVKTLALWVAHAPSPETHNHHPLVCA